MAGDDHLGDAEGSCLSGQAAAKRMGRSSVGVFDTGQDRVLPHDEGDRFVGQSRAELGGRPSELCPLADHTENRPVRLQLFGRYSGQPVVDRGDRTKRRFRGTWDRYYLAATLLIGFRSSNGNHEALVTEFQIANVETGDLRSTHSRAPPQPQQSTITSSQKPVVALSDHPDELGIRDARCLPLLAFIFALDTLQNRPYFGSPDAWKSSELVSLVDRGQCPDNGVDRSLVTNELGEVETYSLLRRREGRYARPFAVADECLEVGPVGFPGRFGYRGLPKFLHEVLGASLFDVIVRHHNTSRMNTPPEVEIDLSDRTRLTRNPRSPPYCRSPRTVRDRPSTGSNRNIDRNR